MTHLLKKSNFIERSIMGALSFLRESVFSDEYASADGFLQSLDPRVKTASFALLLAAVLFTRSIVACLVLYVFCLAVACFSRVNIGFFLKRTWIFIPLFSVFIAIPAIFSFFTPGHALVSFKILGTGFTITRQGLFGALLFISRVAVSVSFAALLSITTKHFELLKVLRIFKVPQVFVMVLGMCYRYIYLFIGVIENTYLAIKSRVGVQVSCRDGRHVVAWNMASLWYRSYRLNEAVYDAMVSRGYAGDPVVMHDFKTKKKDWAWLVFISLVVSGVLCFGTVL